MSKRGSRSAVGRERGGEPCRGLRSAAQHLERARTRAVRLGARKPRSGLDRWKGGLDALKGSRRLAAGQVHACQSDLRVCGQMRLAGEREILACGNEAPLRTLEFSEFELRLGEAELCAPGFGVVGSQCRAPNFNGSLESILGHGGPAAEQLQLTEIDLDSGDTWMRIPGSTHEDLQRPLIVGDRLGDPPNLPKDGRAVAENSGDRSRGWARGQLELFTRNTEMLERFFETKLLRKNGSEVRPHSSMSSRVRIGVFLNELEGAAKRFGRSGRVASSHRDGAFGHRQPGLD